MKITLAASGDVGPVLRAYLADLFAADGGKNSYVAFPFGGLATSASRFEFLNDSSKVEQAYEFALQANSIPQYDAEHAWYFSSNTLWHQYRYWLDQCDTAPITLSKDEVKRLKRARRYCEKHLRVYWSYRTEYLNAEDDYRNWSLMPEADRPPDYASQLTAARDRRDRAIESWELLGHRSEFDAQYAILDDLSRRDPALTKQELRDRLGVPITYDNKEFYWTSLVPQTAFDVDFKWMSFECQFRAATDEGTAGPWFEVAHVAAAGEQQLVERVAAANSKITFEMVRLIVDRDWFAPFLIDSRSWKWPKSTPSDPFAGYPLSSGGQSPIGNLPMIPGEVVFVRNVSISGVEWPSQATRLESLLPRERTVWSGFGVDSIGLKRETRALSGTLVEPATLQYFAFICALLPKSPDPEWRLWNEGQATAP